MKTLKASEIISRNIYLHDLIVEVFGKKNFNNYFNSFVLEVQFQSIFLQDLWLHKTVYKGQKKMLLQQFSMSVQNGQYLINLS